MTEVRIEGTLEEGVGLGGRQEGTFWGVGCGKHPHFDLAGGGYTGIYAFVKLYSPVHFRYTRFTVSIASQ